MKVARTDLYVGIFLIATVSAVVAAVVATSGLWTSRYDVFIRTDDATDITVDTKIYLQGLEVGRVAGINPRWSAQAGHLEFIVRASLLEKFPDGTPLRLPRGADAEVATSLLGRSTLLLVVHDTTQRATLAPGDTIGMHRRPAAVEAFGNLAVDLKGTIQQALEATTGTLRSVQHLADSLSLATGTARRFVAGIQPGSEKTLAQVVLSLERVRRLLDTADVRSGLTMRQLDATLQQSRRLMASADSLSRLASALGGETRPELRAILLNSRLLMEQLLYVTEQLSRRPMRAMTGVQLPDSLTAAGRARRAAAESLQHRTDSPPRDSGRSPQLP